MLLHTGGIDSCLDDACMKPMQITGYFSASSGLAIFSPHLSDKGISPHISTKYCEKAIDTNKYL